MRKTAALAAILTSISLAACGEEDDPVYIPPEGQLEDPTAFFGMEPCTCYEYVRESDWRGTSDPSTITRKLGVAIENFGGDKEFGKDLHIVRYRMEGDRLVRQEFLDPSDPELLLYGVNPTGGFGDDFWRMDPPLSMVRGPLEAGALVRTESQPWLVTPPDQEEEGPLSHFVAQYLNQPEEVEIGKYDEIEQRFHRETVEAQPIRYSGAGAFADDFWNRHVRWFVPELGFVKMTLNLEGEAETWVLLHKRKLQGDLCTPEGAEPRELCGR